MHAPEPQMQHLAAPTAVGRRVRAPAALALISFAIAWALTSCSASSPGDGDPGHEGAGAPASMPALGETTPEADGEAKTAVGSRPQSSPSTLAIGTWLRDGLRLGRAHVRTLHRLPEQVPEPWCRALEPNERLEGVRIASGPVGERPDAEHERSTVEVPIALHARVDVIDEEGVRRTLEGDDLPPCVTIEWSKLEAAVRWHTNKDDEGGTEFTPMPYVATPFARGWRVLADVHPTQHPDPFPDEPTGVGVMRYQVTARAAGEEVRSPGLDSRATPGTFASDVHAVSYRPDTGSWLDYTFELFNAPYVWGSTPRQADAQTAADCADLAVYGLRRAGHDVEYTWSWGMRDITRLRVEITGIADSGEFVTADGESVAFGESARPGDILLFERHIAVLYADDGDGVLDVDDLMIQTNWRHPEIVSFANMRYEHDWFEVRWVPE